MNQNISTPTLRTKTRLQEEREARDIALYKEYNELAANPEQSRIVLRDYLMQKYNLRSTGTLYVILKRVEQRLEAEKEEAL